MNEGLSKGYATAYVQQQADHSCIQEWIDSPRRQQAFNKFVLSSQMEREGKVLEQMAPLFASPFSKPFIPVPWNKTVKSVAVQLVTAAPETEVLEVTQGDQKLYTERSIFLNNLFYLRTKEDCDATLMTVANMSHHTIFRLLQRGLADKVSLDRKIWVLMSIARDLAQIFSLTSLSQQESFDFLIPHQNGALVARTLKATPKVRNSYQGDQWVFSLRTYLEEGMLKPDDRERMAGMDISEDGNISLSWLGQTRDMQRGVLLEADVEHLKGWLKANARPSRSNTITAGKPVSAHNKNQSR